MPTGYTAPVADGKVTDFAEFAWQCARAFGALVMLRDDSNATIPDEFKPSPYYAESVRKAQAELERVRALTPAEADAEAQREYDDAVARNAQYAAERAETRKRYECMLAEVEAWVPPSPDHVEMKNFMREQLADSIRHDCSDLGLYADVKRKPGKAWHSDKLAAAERDVAYYTRNLAEELERVAGRNRWLRQLRDSLNQTTVTV